MRDRAASKDAAVDIGRRAGRRGVSSLALACVSLACLCLAGCGGGGSSGGNATPGGGTPTTPTEPPPTTPVTPVSSAESGANHGIGQIRADHAYAEGATGAGVRVAVIDSGIALNHPEFSGRIDRQASIDIVTRDSATLNDQNGHGTHVAGIIAASVNDAGPRGVAPQATLVAIRADLRDSSVCAGPGCGYFDHDVAAALDHARASGAQVINLSIGKETAITAGYREALERAVASGALVVVAAGNQSLAEVLMPGRLADTAGLRGGMLVVGAVDKNNAIYSRNNKAGAAEPFFLVAPGVDIYSTYLNNGYRRLSGTSMATPHVAGAAAALKSYFPSLTMQQVASILIETADDLGAQGRDQTYGNGLVNLERAMRPIGQQQVASGDDLDGRRHGIENSRLTLGPAFGDALENHPSSAQGMVLDAYDRPYRADFSGLIGRRAASADFGQLMIDTKLRRELQLEALEPLGLDGRLELSERRDRPVAGSALAALDGGPMEDGGQAFERLSFQGIESPLGEVSFGIGMAPSAIGAAPSQATAGGLFLDAAPLLAPSDAIIERGTGASLGIALSETSSLHVGILDSDGMQVATAGQNDLEGRVLALGTDHRLGQDTSLQLHYAYLDESTSMLGSAGTGAFALGDGAISHLGTARLAYQPSATLELFAQATFGLSTVDGGDSMLRDWSDVRSDAFAVGLVAADVASEGDRLGVILGQPLRVNSASAVLDIPTGRTLDGRIERGRERVDMEPSGRELRLELAYQRPLDEQRSIGSWLMLQHEPGHDAEAEPALGVGVRFTSRW